MYHSEFMSKGRKELWNRVSVMYHSDFMSKDRKELWNRVSVMYDSMSKDRNCGTWSV